MKLARNVGAAVAGYLVMFLVAFCLMSVLWLAIGADGALQAGSWDVSGAWITGSVVLGLLVSMSGGFTSSKLGDGVGSVGVLVGLVIVVGVLQALPEATSTGVRPDGVSMFDAMSQLRQPTWLLWTNPVLGVIGVLLGAKLESRGSSPG